MNMKNNKTWGVVDAEAYRVPAPRRIDTAFLKSMDWPKDKPGLRIEFTSAISLAKLPPVKLPGGYLVRLACNSARKGVKRAGENVPAAGIEARPPKNLAELKKVNLLVYKAYVKTWGKKVGRNFSAASLEYQKKYLPITKSLIMFKQGKPVGLYSLLKYALPSGKLCDLVAWHNHMPGLSAAERRSFWHQGAVWFSKTAKRQLVVGLDLFDKESLQFFSILGFKVTRIRFERL